MNRLLIILIFSTCFIFITNGQDLSLKKNPKVNKELKIQEIIVEPKPDFGFTSFRKISNDTIDFVVCTRFVYYPFGEIENEIELRKSLLNLFEINDKKDKGGYACQVLKFKSSKLLLFFSNNSEGPISSYILKGEIYDDEVVLIKDIRIGMSKKEFFNLFFDSFPQILEERFNEIGFVACVDGTNHYYSFKNNKLKSIRFECPDCTGVIEY